MADMQYDPTYIEPLYTELHDHFKTLVAQGHDMQTAAKKMEHAWADNEGSLGEFRKVHAKWDNEFSDTLKTLNAVAAAVEGALRRAISTDVKVGDGFSMYA
ncbi:hypothetical protein [Nocardia sp. NPDC052566]|uniref:hypothetical protein n=1 Tax=Nocardia sp. NPDC052566 TaxID=3364330 RepID=UPI0037CB28F8